MKNKVRTIVVMQKKFNWVLASKSIRSSQNTWNALSRLTIFSSEKGQLVINFKTRDDGHMGKPLNTGILLTETRAPQHTLNLNHPSIIREIIEFLVNQKRWSFENRKHLTLENGLEILAQMGYQIAELQPDSEIQSG
jgi:Tat protein secretion system quality control protein TatD with DNase activity